MIGTGNVFYFEKIIDFLRQKILFARLLKSKRVLKILFQDLSRFS